MEKNNNFKDNFTVCNDAWKNIIEKYDKAAILTDFKEDERTIALIWTVTGIVGNGGFEYLFSSNLPGDENYELTLKAFEDIKCDEAVSILNDVRSLFPNGEIPPDPDMRMNFFNRVPEEIRDCLAVRFFNANSAIEDALAKYIKVAEGTLGMAGKGDA